MTNRAPAGGRCPGRNILLIVKAAEFISSLSTCTLKRDIPYVPRTCKVRGSLVFTLCIGYKRRAFRPREGWPAIPPSAEVNMPYFLSFFFSFMRSGTSGRCYGAFWVLPVCLLCLCLAACAAPEPSVPRALRSDNETELPRAHPGYVQWLEKQSILRQSDDLISIVSGTPLVWGASGSERNIIPLLNAADVWLDFSPSRAALGEKMGESALAVLPRALPPRLLASLGIRGIFLSSVAESAGDWNVAPDSGGPSLESEAVIGMRFASPAAAKDTIDEPSQDYARLDEYCAQEGVILGGEILPGSTGMGPDFRLARMGLSRYADLYMMVEAPREIWPLLPAATLQEASGASSGSTLKDQTEKSEDTLDVAPLHASSIAELTRRGILPPAFSRDTQSTLPRGGWAATAPLTGTDGVTRRWLYRYADTPRTLPLHWDAPRASAQRAFSASIIRQAGLLHQPLLRINLADMAGLEPASPGAFSPEPALSALAALSRDIRRYGGWSMLGDFVPPAMLAEVQRRGVDFAPDSITSPALEYALLTGDADPLRRNLDASLTAGVDHARLWRSTPNKALPLGREWLPAGAAPPQAQQANVSPIWAGRVMQNTSSGPVLLASAPTLAAAVTAASGTEQSAPLDAHLLQVAFRAFLPGLLALSGHDLFGAIQEETDTEHSGDNGLPLAWNADGKNAFSSAGLPARAAYPPLNIQLGLPDSFATRLKQITRIRRESGIARGVLLGRAKTGKEAGGASNAVVACISRLPDASLLLVAGNFSPRALVTDLVLPQDVRAARAEDMMTGRGVTVSARNMPLQMKAWGVRVVRLFPR